jgi:V-type H+-transporting ATPase subunit C
MSIDEYVNRWAWDESKFSSASSLKELVQHIQEGVAKLDEDARIRVGEYSQLVNALASEARKVGQTLLTRDLNDIQMPPLFSTAITESLGKSEYLEAIFIVVPK